jgi:hypothetical protein
MRKSKDRQHNDQKKKGQQDKTLDKKLKIEQHKPN